MADKEDADPGDDADAQLIASLNDKSKRRMEATKACCQVTVLPLQLLLFIEKYIFYES